MTCPAVTYLPPLCLMYFPTCRKKISTLNIDWIIMFSKINLLVCLLCGCIGKQRFGWKCSQKSKESVRQTEKMRQQ